MAEEELARVAWYHCPNCLRAWTAYVPSGITEEEYIKIGQLVCSWGCFDYRGGPNFNEAVRPAYAVRCPYAIRETLEAAFRLGGHAATVEVIKGWHAQVFGDPCG